MIVPLKAIFTLLACSNLGVSAFYGAKSPVKSIKGSEFNSVVLKNTKQVHFVEFYAPWCGHCKNLIPHYTKAASSLAGMVQFVAIDCDDDKEFCATQGIQGFPTLKVFYPYTSSKDAGVYKKNSVDYQGERTAKAISDYAVERMRHVVIRLTHGKTNAGATGIDDFVSGTKTELPKAILFTEKETTSALYKALSMDLQDRMALAEARGKTLADRFKVVKFPTLIVFPTEGNEIIYDGDLKRDSLLEFLKKYALPGQDDSAEEKVEDKEEAFDPEVLEIASQTELDERCVNAKGLCFITLLDTKSPDHDENLTLLRLLKKNDHARKGPFHFHWISSLRSTSMANNFGMADERPSVVMVSGGRRVWRVMLGAWDVESVERWMRETVTGKGRGIASLDFDVKLDEEKVEKTEQAEKVASEETQKPKEADTQETKPKETEKDASTEKVVTKEQDAHAKQSEAEKRDEL